MRRLLLAVVLASCTPIVESEVCDVTPEPISLPADCWEDPTCLPATEAEATCGRAYVCDYEQPDGSFYPMCVVVQDCDCLDDIEACGVDVERPAHCER